MKKICLVFISLLFLISCSKEGDSGNSSPKSGVWNVSTEFGGFVFTVNSDGTNITEIAITHSNWSCGGVTLGGTLTLSSNPGWAITNRDFTIEQSFDPMSDNQVLTITGTFNNSGNEASGEWTEKVYGSTCSGTWEVSF